MGWPEYLLVSADCQAEFLAFRPSDGEVEANENKGLARQTSGSEFGFSEGGGTIICTVIFGC